MIIFRNSFEKIQISLKCDNTSNNGHLTLRPIYIFDHIPLSVLLRMRNVSNKFVEKSKMHILCSITLFPKVEAFISNVFMVKSDRQGNMIRRILFACFLTPVIDRYSKYLILLIFHGNSGYTNASQSYVCTYSVHWLSCSTLAFR